MTVQASSFADPTDVRAFDACKAAGKSDAECFKVGDNGIGCWGDHTAQTHTAMCALPPETIEAKWGNVEAGKHKRVWVRVVNCLLADRMPHLDHIKNGAGIDLNPAAADALGLKPPFLREVSWEWDESKNTGGAPALP